MRIRCLRTGIVRERTGTHGVGRYVWAAWSEGTLPVNAFLIEHAAGLCLFDAGQTARASTRGYFPRWQPFFRLARFELEPGDEVEAQLDALGIATTDVRWVVLSHLHTDHVGGLAAFHDADVLVSRSEWVRAQGPPGRIRGYLPQYWPDGLRPRLLDVDTGGFGPFPGSFDLAGDGSLLVVATPGHTPGHTSLLVRDSSGLVLLGGDLAHNEPELRDRAPAVARYCAETGAVYVGAHDWSAEDLLQAHDTEQYSDLLTTNSGREET